MDQFLCAAYQWAKFARARQVVANAVPRRCDAFDRPLQFLINDLGIGSGLGVRDVEDLVQKPLIQELNAPHVAAVRCCHYDLFHVGGINGFKELLKNREIEPFIFQCKDQVTVNCR